MKILMSDRMIEKVLVTAASFSILTLIFESLGWSQGPWSVAILLLLCFGGSSFARIHSRLPTEFPDDHFSLISYWCFLTFGVLSVLFYATETTGNHLISNPNINGDWPMHLNQILFLSKTSDFWPVNPILAGEPMRYAFGINWLTAMFVKAGFPVMTLVILSGILSVVMTASLLKKTFGALGLWAFFASGGGWGFSQWMLLEAWGPSSQLAWKNLFLAVYMPQRGFWFALPAGLYLLRFLVGFWDKSHSHQKVLNFPASFIFLWAVLPFFHLHTFVAVSFFVLITVLNQRAWFAVFSFLPGLPVALFFIFKSVSGENAGRALQWSSGWMTGSLDLVTALMINYGSWLLVLLIVVISILARPGQRFILTSLLALAILFHFVLLAPWPWDQIKIVLWFYLALGYFLAQEIRLQFKPLVGALLIVFLHSVGFVQLMGGWPAILKPTTLWSLADQNSVKQLLNEVPVEERLLIAPEAHHPVWSSGRAVVSGYEGHIWAHGVNTEGLKDSIFALFNGQQIQSLRFSRLSAKFLLWGPYERTWFSQDVPPEAVWIKLKSVGDYSLYSRLPQVLPSGK